jgi:hypothetical protein
MADVGCRPLGGDFRVGLYGARLLDARDDVVVRCSFDESRGFPEFIFPTETATTELEDTA